MGRERIFDKNGKRKRSFTYAAMVWTITLLWLSLTPSSSIPKIRIVEIPHLDKIVHFSMYFILTILVLSAHLFRGIKINKIFLLALCFLYSIVIEMLQSFMKLGRYFDYYDIFANLIGIIIGFLIFEKLLKSISLWKLH